MRQIFFLFFLKLFTMKLIGAFPNFSLNYKTISLLFGLFLLSNYLTFRWSSEVMGIPKPRSSQLYLLEEARRYVYDVPSFEGKVIAVSKRLDIPTEWLMAVMYAESRFDASARNHKGSSALGLIQFMPATLKSLGTTPQKLQNMNHVEQMDLVYKYLSEVQEVRGEYRSLTDLYLGILYPDAIGEDFCYTLYAKPDENYVMNMGLDANKDGRVTVQDIDQFLRRIYPTAYYVSKTSSAWW